MMWTDIVGALATALEAVVVLGAVIYARGQLAEARTLREQQTRPYVVVDLDMQSRPPIINLSVGNIGQSSARDVQISFEPPLRSTLDKDRPRSELPFLRSGIPTLPPRKRIETIFDTGPDRFNANLEDTYTAKVKYKGDAGRTYEDTYILDIGMFYGLEYITPRGLADLHGELREIRQEIQKWRGPGLRGLLVKTTQDEDDYQQETLALRDARRADRDRLQDPGSEPIESDRRADRSPE